MTPGERHDAVLRAAASITVHLVLGAILNPRPVEDAGEAAAGALREALDWIGAGAGEMEPPARLTALAPG